jgi:predicted nuclease of restriction endonuclease-like (RecB) superfamily
LFERTAISKRPELTVEKEIELLRASGELNENMVLKDPYVLDFLELNESCLERDLEDAILRELQQFLLELGAGFTFVARQYRIQVDGEDFYIDLLFYNRKLKRLVAVDLKLGRFKAEYKGQMELYLKVEPNAADTEMRTFGTLGVLRHGIRDRGTRFSLCQFKPEHGLNPDTSARYGKNRLRVVPELVYSPWAADEALAETGAKAKKWRIDLVLFVNGLPVATLELKSEFKQSVDNAVRQYKTTRFPVDPATKKPEPLLTFKRGALVHFAVSQYEIYMATRLEGAATCFLPFNKGTAEGAPATTRPRISTGMPMM